MGEQLNLTAAVVKTTTKYTVARMDLDWENKRITVIMLGDNGERLVQSYADQPTATPPTTQATTLMVALNKANLTVKSLQRRVIEQLVADGVLAGAVAGVPD